jgi:hypothetical protein
VGRRTAWAVATTGTRVSPASSRVSAAPTATCAPTALRKAAATRRARRASA